MSEILHSLPGIGDERIVLYDPSDVLYRKLQSKREVARLNKLRHLGAQSRTFQGARHARWDYTMAMLYYIQHLQISGINSKFRIGDARFTSGKAALQTLALAWNVGHLPGTFAVEKGLFRFLHETNRLTPSEVCNWKFINNTRVVALREAGEVLLKEGDYRTISRVLAVSKLLDMCDTEGDELFELVVDFIAPFILGATGSESTQWSKISRSFKLVRHLAYLTIDLPFVGLQWSPNIPSLFAQTVASDDATLFTIDSAIREILSPVEKSVYDRLYHHTRARHEVAIVSGHVYGHLAKSADPKQTVGEWLNAGLFRELRIGRLPKSTSLRLMATVKFRSQFLASPETPSEIEASLIRHGFTEPVVFEYRSWNAETVAEPNELIIDLYSWGTIDHKEIGRALIWVIDRYDSQIANSMNVLAIYRKFQLETVYIDLISQALQLNHNQFVVRIVPWDLNLFGLLGDIDIPENKGGVWCAKGDFSNPILGHILRDRSSRIESRLKEKYGELSGLRTLRQWLRKKSSGKDVRCRWLVITASIQFWDGSRSIIEFDGAVVRISARSGTLRVYALEAKMGSENPAKSLLRRITALGIHGEVSKLSKNFAVLDFTLSDNSE